MECICKSQIEMNNLQVFQYTTSKHAVLGLTRADAVDNALNHIRINCVTPGLIDTNLGAHIPKEIRDRELTPGVMKTPMRRMGEANEVANSVVFLSSRMASYITGASLAVSLQVLWSRTWLIFSTRLMVALQPHDGRFRSH